MTAFELGLVTLSALLHASWSVAIKGSRDPVAFNFLQMLPQALVMALALAWIDFAAIPPLVWKLLFCTSIAHGLYLFWMSRAYELSDLSLVYPIARSAPAFLPLVAVPLLGETISPTGALGIAIAVAGIWLVQAGSGLRWHALLERGSVYAYLTLATTIAYGLADKGAMTALNAEEWRMVIPRSLLYYGLLELGCGMVLTPLVLWKRSPSQIFEVARLEWRPASLAILFTVSSYGLILEALRSAPVSYVVATRQISVLFAVALSTWWLGERPTPLRVAGAAATVVGVALVALAG